MYVLHCFVYDINAWMFIKPGDNGTLYFWDWKTGYNFQRIQAAVQPGSIDSEAGIFAATFDKSGTRLITCEADKTIKIYKEDETAVSTHYRLIKLTYLVSASINTSSNFRRKKVILSTGDQILPKGRDIELACFYFYCQYTVNSEINISMYDILHTL